MYCPEAEEHIKKLEHSLDNILEENQRLQAQIDRYEPVLLWVEKLVELWEMRLDTLPDNCQELCRLYRKAKEEDR